MTPNGSDVKGVAEASTPPTEGVDNTDTPTSAEVAALRAEVAELRRQVDAALDDVRSLPRPAGGVQ